MVGKRRNSPVLRSRPVLVPLLPGATTARSAALVLSSMALPCPRPALSEMTIRRPPEFEFPAVCSDQMRFASSLRHSPDFGDAHAGGLGGAAQALELARRHARQDLIVVAAGEDGLDQARVCRERGAGRRRQRQLRHVDPRVDTGGAAHFCEIAREPVGNIHAAIGVAAQRLRSRVARLGHEIAPQQMLAHPAIESPTLRRALAPPRSTIVPRGTVPKAATVTVRSPGVRSVSPPRSGQPYFLASAPRPAAKRLSQLSLTLLSAIDKRKPSGRAPLPARSERLMRNALRATASGGSSAKKCTPAITASVLRTRSWPAGMARTAASSTRASAPGWVASGRKCRAIRRSSPEVPVDLRRAIVGPVVPRQGYAVPASRVSRPEPRTRRPESGARACRAPR